MIFLLNVYSIITNKHLDIKPHALLIILQHKAAPQTFAVQQEQSASKKNYINRVICKLKVKHFQKQT